MLLRETKLLFEPILELLHGGVHRPSWEIEAELARQFNLADDELKQKNPKGGLVWTNNVANAFKELRKAKIIDGKISRAPTGGYRNVYFIPGERLADAQAGPSSAPHGEEKRQQLSELRKKIVTPEVIEAAEHVLSEIARMATIAVHTAAYANGQTVVTIIKNKDIAFTREQLEDEIAILLKEQGHCCKLTGYDFMQKTSNIHLKMSLDRKDSSKGYIPGNLQVVTRAANFYKSASDDTDWKLKALALEHMAVALQARRKNRT
jgi:Mrr N-terminal domain